MIRMRTQLVFSLFCILLLVTGCAHITITQKLHRDGTSDVSIEVTSSFPTLINLMKQNLSDTWEGATVIDLENGFRGERKGMSFAELSKNQMQYLKNVRIDRQFKFPFYYYTLTFESTGMSSEDVDITAFLSADYVIIPFGKITRTNGIYTSEEKTAVKFNLVQQKEYYITFRDFFLWSWFGGASGLVKQASSSAPAAQTPTPAPVVQTPTTKARTTREQNAILLSYTQQKGTLDYGVSSTQQMIDALQSLTDVESQKEVLTDLIKTADSQIKLAVNLQAFIDTNRETLKLGGYNPDYEKQKIIQEQEQMTRVLVSARNQLREVSTQPATTTTSGELLAECNSVCITTSRTDKPSMVADLCSKMCASKLQEGTQAVENFISDMKARAPTN